jgi:hypothetical protein
MEREIMSLYVLLAIEVVALSVAWLMARQKTDRVLHLRLRCPLDGGHADVDVDVDRRTGHAIDIRRCSRVERGQARDCDRSCKQLVGR